MINSHEGRFDEVFREYFHAQVDPHLSEAPVMIDHGENLDYAGKRPACQVHDIVEAPLPLEDWLWLLSEGGLDVVDCQELSSPHFRTFVCRAAASR